MIYRLIEALSSQYTTKVLCKVLGVSRSSYYDYLSGRSWSLSTGRAALEADLKEVFHRHKSRYGSRRLTHEVNAMGHDVGRHQVRTMMKSLNLRAIQPKSFVPKTTQADSSRRRSPNLLLDLELSPQGTNQIVVGDITFLPSETGWLYMAVWMDLFSRRIVAWQVDDNMMAGLVIHPMRSLITKRQPSVEMIVHTDGGTQYKSVEFRRLLKRHGFRQSMTRKDNHYDNAHCESLFSRIKAELLSDYPVFRNLQDARTKVFEYIEGYYNSHRRHSSLEYLSPREFEDLHG